ncbi:phage tail protein, partial [Bacillus thuringiensis]
PALKGLKDFDPKVMYPAYPGMTPMTSKQKQMKMGEVSNLITDMTIGGANQAEIARAVRHSMVVIDAEKHKLNYKQSEIDNGIAALKKKYQGKANAGASTLISRASSEKRIPERKARSASKGGPIDKKTGRKVYE